MSLSYKNQSIDLLCKLMNWFLYDKDLRHKRVNTIQFRWYTEILRYQIYLQSCSG